VIHVEYLDLDDIVEMVRALKVGPICDVGLLDSAVNRPRASAFGDDAYPTLDLKAAALLHSMTKNDALVDGNKRVAWLSTVVYCDLNGYVPELSDDDAFQIVWDIARDSLDVAVIAHRLQLRRIANRSRAKKALKVAPDVKNGVSPL
jgi:death on curing protein